MLNHLGLYLAGILIALSISGVFPMDYWVGRGFVLVFLCVYDTTEMVTRAELP